MNHRVVSVLCVAATLSLAGCPGGGPNTCSNADIAIATPPVTLSVFDQGGAFLDGVTVTWSQDGGDEFDCLPTGEQWSCGTDAPGELEIRIQKTGYEEQVLQLTVEMGDCAVVPQLVEVVLEELPCTEELRPSVVVRITDSQGLSVETADVGWAPAEEDGPFMDCAYIIDNEWICAEEISGDLRISVDNAGPYQYFEEVVTVETEPCHVITETLDVVLEYLQD